MGSLPVTGSPAAGVASAEADLLVAAAAGDREALRWLLDEVAPIVYGFIFARVGGDEGTAEDLLQETLLEAVRSGAGFRGDSKASTWLCAIARRRLVRHYDRERKAELTRSRLRAVHEESEWTQNESVEQRDEVIRALGQLTPLHRQVLVLKYLDGLAVPDIAAALGRSRVQVQSLLQRARESLRTQLEVGDA